MRISVVVITRNRPSILKSCRAHLQAQTLPPLEVIVVDSSDRVVPDNDLHFAFPRGRAQMPRARNFGIGKARGEVVAFLDDDCLADPTWLEELARGYGDGIAGVGGRITDPRWSYDPERKIGDVDAAGRVQANFFGGGEQTVMTLPGGNMSFRRDWLLKVGGFDPGYVASNHREEHDLCLRVGRAGGRLVYRPQANVVHLNARVLLGELKPYQEFYYRYSFARNEAYFTVKHFASRIQAWRRLLTEDARQWARELRESLSLMVLMCGPVILASKLIGIAQGLRALRRRAEDHFEH